MMLRSVTQGLQDPLLRIQHYKYGLKLERWTHGVDHGEDDLYDVLVCVHGEVLRHVSAVYTISSAVSSSAGSRVLFPLLEVGCLYLDKKIIRTHIEKRMKQE
jgi:hypothetical protein